MSKKDIINEIKSKQLPVIIYGAGVVGKALLSVCQKEGISVECFCDGNKEVKQFCGKEVVFVPNLKTKYKEAVFLISTASINDAVDWLSELGFVNWYAGGLLLKDLDVSQGQALLDYDKYTLESCILCHDGYLNKDKLFVRSIDFIITERCSLKCQNCSNLMQYYEKPRHCDVNLLLKSIDAFFQVVDEAMDSRVIGGETFINPEWPIIVKRLANEPKTKRIVLYTNATIVPKDISQLKNDKVVVMISDYGALSRNLAQLKKVFEENKIAYYVFSSLKWLDCAKIMPHNYSPEKNTEIYKNCCGKNMATLSDGKLFRCPYAANANRLRATPDDKNDYVDLFDAAGLSETRNKVREYLSSKKYLTICDYCDSRPLSGPEVPPAVQITKPLEYRKY